jgi:hypothetical protein
MRVLPRHEHLSVPPASSGYTHTHDTPLSPARLGDATIRAYPKEEIRMDREQLLENLRWLAEGNPQYAGTDEEGRQNTVVAHLMADDFLLSYVDDREITELFNSIRKENAS